MNSRLRSLLALSLLLYPVTAFAHSPYPGIRGFYTGLLHPLTTASHILLIVAISILLGARQPANRTLCLVSLFAATALGLLTAFLMAGLLPTQTLVLLLTTGLGVLLLAPIQLPEPTFPVLTGLSGFLLALESIPDPGPFLDVLITTFGALVGIHYLVMYGSRGAAAAVQRWSSPALLIGIRVAGSWIVAIGCLMLAFVYAGIGSEFG